MKNEKLKEKISSTYFLVLIIFLAIGFYFKKLEYFFLISAFILVISRRKIIHFIILFIDKCQKKDKS